MIPFERQWERIEKELIEAQRRTVTQAASQVYKSTVDRTPIGRPELWKSSSVPDNYIPGDLRKAWEINWGNGFIHATASFSGKLDSVAGAGNYRLGTDIYIRNQTEYAHAIEYGRSTQQAPAGMMRISVRQYQTFLTKAAKKNKL